MKSNAMRLLEENSIAFVPHEYDISDGQIDGCSIARKLGKSEDEVFKTLVTEAPGPEYFVFVVPVSGELNLKKAARAAKVKSIEMIPLKKLLPLTGYIHGGCSPIGMKKKFPTFIDETAILFDRMFVSGGYVGLNLEIAPEELAGFIEAEFADIT